MSFPRLRSLVLVSFVACACEGVLDGERDAADRIVDASRARDAARSGDDAQTGIDARLPPDPDGGTPDGVPVFVAIGKYARITTSCDDGASWPFDRSDDDGGSCVGVDCDHHPGSSTGITSGGGHFFASFGWGDHPSRILRSANGVDWETVYDMRGFSFAGIAWAGDRLVGGDTSPRYSLDLGESFMSAEWPPYEVPEGAWPNARQIHYIPASGGVIGQLNAEGGGSWADTVISRDGGLTFTHPSSLPEECRGHSRPMVYGGGVWLQLWATTGIVCRSLDAGETWTSIDVGEGEMSNAIWTGDEFVFYAGRRGHRSADGAAWTSFDVNVSIGVVAHSPVTGTFVAADNGGWGSPYSAQRFYRSPDGVAWDELPEGAFEQSHPITHIAFGYTQPSENCP